MRSQNEVIAVVVAIVFTLFIGISYLYAAIKGYHAPIRPGRRAPETKFGKSVGCVVNTLVGVFFTLAGIFFLLLLLYKK